MRPKARYFRYFTYIRPVIRSKIVRTYGSTIFTLAIIIIFILFAIKPTVETILVLQKKLENATQVLEKINQKSKALTQAKENYQNLDPNIKNKIQALIPDTVGIKSVIQTLEGVAVRHEASVSALQVQPLILENKTKATVTQNLAEVAFTFNIEGAYKNLISLLQDLKTSSRLISIDNLSLSQVSEGEGLIMSISGKAYYLK